MYPGHWSKIKPTTPAVIHAASGDQRTWQALDERSNRAAQLFRSLGLQVGDHLALLMQNHLDYFEIAWGAFRSGLYITCVNRYLTADEAAYIVQDSGAKLVIASTGIDTVDELLPLIADCPNKLITHGTRDGWQSYGELVDYQPSTPLASEPMGDSMLYSSGTTGRPKGIKRPLTGLSVTAGIPGVEKVNPYNIDEQTVYLSPAPLYHAAPFGYCMRVLALGGTVVMMERFDPELSLQYIEQFQITHSQWVPTMFVRMLKIDEATRTKYDLKSHTCAIHAAAPCPVVVKQQMIDWWGPILWEYYAGTERNGSTVINSAEWLAHPGSVGKARSGIIRICDDKGTELPTGEAGTVYFEQESQAFEYHNAPEKTKGATHPTQPYWTALGDVGYLDAEGYLYLTDRKAFMIVSGGVNIYPQEIEDALIMHDQVTDVAVFGVPNDEFGEEVKAVVQPADARVLQSSGRRSALVDELTNYARTQLAPYKVPRSIDFLAELPRLPTGKLYKRLLKDEYWP